MTVALKAPDPRTGRALPSGENVARVLLALSRRQAADVLARLNGVPGRAPALDHWVAPMADALLPLFLAFAEQGGKQALREIAGQYALARPKAWGDGVVKDRAKPPFALGFDVRSPKVIEAVRNAVFTFCQETLATATRQVDEALDELRAQLAAGLERGEAQRELNRRVVGIFADPYRAARIAQTEASRAVHAGSLMAAEQSGVVGRVRWVASADSCPLCQELDGKEVPLGEVFAVDGVGVYSRIFHPPRHPHC